LLTRAEGTDGVEVATIGNEGLVGVSLSWGAEALNPAEFLQVQVPGAALRMDAGVFRSELARDGRLAGIVRRYAQAFSSQLCQQVACNALHSIEERCARWMLLTHDRVGLDEFALTQEFLAQMLGVRRASITQVAGVLQRAEVISYHRGRVTVTDRARLEASSCEYYRVLRLPGAEGGLRPTLFLACGSFIPRGQETQWLRSHTAAVPGSGNEIAATPRCLGTVPHRQLESVDLEGRSHQGARGAPRRVGKGGGNMLANATSPPAAADEDATDFPKAGPATAVPVPAGAIAIVLAVGLIITGVVTWTSWSLNNHNDARLLKLQTDQAAEVLTAAVPDSEAPLATAVEVASATDGAVGAFTRFMSPYIAANGTFVSASLWQMTATSPRRVAVVGVAPGYATSSEAGSFVARAFRTHGGFVAGAMFRGKRGRLVFALALPGTKGRFAVYAEHAVPADRRATVAKNSAFSDLNYAIYLGSSKNPADLLTTSQRLLPLTGLTAKVSVPFGDTVLTLVASPAGQLGGTLPARLPWIFAVLGILITLAAAWTTERLVRRRRSAERDAAEIRRLYTELGSLFSEQRTIAETLQRALLPRETPEIAGMEVAVQYVPGAKGMEIGGDWYSFIPIDGGRFAFVVGDVSGRGLNAATVMAALRFTIRTYALEGYSPSAILDKCSKQLHVLVDGHFATVLVGVGDVSRHEITLANAGHFNPLVIDGQNTSFIETSLGVPLGVSGGSYESVTVCLPPKSTLIAFTDGLVEHRGESLDVGLERLQQVAQGQDCPLDLLLANVISDLTDETSEDDIAMLGLRWTS